MSKMPIGTKSKTGENCPEPGVWRPEGESETAPIAKASLQR